MDAALTGLYDMLGNVSEWIGSKWSNPYDVAHGA
ncbi:hypothetical protein D5085_04140 [Ectothiorhodospiraceae bacterium BW-2]|nr:hypothetical protein D5085_04140 [Ectothiorhodospiraceae bacterium BW-2]